jgi:hypothetical protein
VSALEGEGDMDNDGYVTGTELESFFCPRWLTIQKEHNILNTVKFVILMDKGDFVLH